MATTTTPAEPSAVSTCDRCYSPGACCKRVFLSTLDGEPLTVWEGDEASQLPFVPAEKWGSWVDAESGRTFAAYLWNCSNLRPDGRCGDYENRPDLCRRFEPGSTSLCVHWRGAESGEESVL